jgi:energy-converting hydrogenase Eha subunit B
MTALDVPYTTLRELQTQLDLLAGMLLGSLAKILRPRLIVREGETASTDGKVWVKLPLEFLGIRLGERTEIFTALLGHEVGHWLQPLDRILEVEKKTGLHHDIVNTILDVHNEALIVSIFPLLRGPLASLRTLVSSKQKREYLEGYRNAGDFLGAASAAFLYGRYCVDPFASFGMPEEVIKTKNRKAVPDSSRMAALCARINNVVGLKCRDLPSFFEELSVEYPELCIPDSPGLLFDPLGGAICASGGDGTDALQGELYKLGDLQPDYQPPDGVIEARPTGHIPAGPDVLALSRKLQARWAAPRCALAIPAPGRLNRQAAVRGEPLPFSMPVQAKGRQMPRTRVVLLVDWSGSMKGAPWGAALKAAQAITLALRTSGGDVRAGIFSGNLWHAPGFSPDALFAASLGPVSMSEANGPDTSFRWLPRIWQLFPDYRVLLLTDGYGYTPQIILPSQKARTAAILLQVRRNYSPEDVMTIEEVVGAVADRFVHVDALEDLAAAWATLIPRRSIA